ncbi:hypothetical protein [Paenibacillus campi]|uniref:hypothetical protein n=1 Tax=Paenibacillus campi TaxID=3106031 RepID=UPI002AFDFB39|nr:MULTISPECIES: hypothetical protein [unclassified Paenibacillus]
MRYVLLLIWLAFIGYAVFLTPGTGEADPYLRSLLTLQADEPSLMAMFTLLGLFPLAYACLLLRGDNRGIPAWPFVIGSFALGAFALLPYFILTASGRWAEHHHDVRTAPSIRRSAEGAATHWILLLLTVGVIAYGWIGGDQAAYAQAFNSSSFVHTMTIDFVVLTLLSVYAISRDERAIRQPAGIMWIGLIPVIGLLLYVWRTRESVRI